MELSVMERNLALFWELITCGHAIYYWTFDAAGSPLETNCPMPEHFRVFLDMNTRKMQELLDRSAQRLPLVLTGAVGSVWLADFAFDEASQLARVCCIGPVFTEDRSAGEINAVLNQMHLFGTEITALGKLLRHLPVMSITRFYDFGLMLHYCITGEKIALSDFQYGSTGSAQKKEDHASGDTASHGTWAMEQELLRMIEDGDLDYKKKAARMVSTGQLGQLGNGDPVRNLKNLTIIFTALCTRAAIRGGLTPEIAYTLSDRYISSIESSKSISEIAEVNAAMQEDFVTRVHQRKVQQGMTPQIQNCCNYLRLHATETIRIPALAQKMGYSISHLSKLFKQETGLSIGEYIMQCRMELAKDALRLSGESVSSICHRLGFESQSYFGKQFKQATGMTPGEYRIKQGVDK